MDNIFLLSLHPKLKSKLAMFHKKFYFYFPFLLLVCVLSTPVYAVTSTADNFPMDSLQIDEVVVTGTRNATDIRHLPMTVNVIGLSRQVQQEALTFAVSQVVLVNCWCSLTVIPNIREFSVILFPTAIRH